jgi:adenylate cyclase class 2
MVTYIEQEAKFRISNPQALRSRLEALGAVLMLDHQHEINIRFDQADGSYKAEHKVLRLRIDQKARLTYKGAAQEGTEVSVRKEIEFEVNDADAATAFLQCLGFQPFETYEKYRTTYHLHGLEVVLDELPYGDFVEIEGEDEDQIHQTADALGLNWEKRCKFSYLELFYHLNEKHGLDCAHLTFDGYPAQDPAEEWLDAEIADG